MTFAFRFALDSFLLKLSQFAVHILKSRVDICHVNVLSSFLEQACSYQNGAQTFLDTDGWDWESDQGCPEFDELRFPLWFSAGLSPQGTEGFLVF